MEMAKTKRSVDPAAEAAAALEPAGTASGATAEQPAAEGEAAPAAAGGERKSPRRVTAAGKRAKAAEAESVPAPAPAVDAGDHGAGPAQAHPPSQAPAAEPAAAGAAAAPQVGPEAQTEGAGAAPGGSWTGEEDWVEEIGASFLQSKYTLVSVAAKRARQLLAGSKRRVESLSEKPVTVALEELAAGKLYFERTRDGIK
jgi:DNA-directed RNA polymerase subunit omega